MGGVHFAWGAVLDPNCPRISLDTMGILILDGNVDFSTMERLSFTVGFKDTVCRVIHAIRSIHPVEPWFHEHHEQRERRERREQAKASYLKVEQMNELEAVLWTAPSAIPSAGCFCARSGFEAAR